MISRERLKRVLLSCLREGGNIISRGFGTSYYIRKKSPVSLVTEIDIRAEKKIISLIRKSFPSHRILTEESSPRSGTSPYRWIIDPLDGTTNFAHKIPLCCVSVGVEYEGKVILGGINNPFLKEFFFAEAQKGSYLNGRRIYVSKTAKMIDSLLVTGFPYDRQEKAAFYLNFFKAIMEKSQGIRRLGSAAMDLAYVACGRFDAFWEFNLKSWDVAAGVLLVKEAGGHVCDCKGEPLILDRLPHILVSNGKIHSLLLKIFKGVFLKTGI